MDLSQFAQQLPSADEAPEPIEATSAFAVLKASASGFVPPGLVVMAEPDEAVATLITAPAAAGKSTCAKAIVATTGGLYLNLAGKRVADGSFAGLIDEAFGEETAPVVKSRLRRGEITLVVDALDETNVTSRDANFNAFLVGLCRFLRSSVGRKNVILMSRSETAVWITGAFESEGVPLFHLGLDYFDRDQSMQFIDHKLEDLYADTQRAAIHKQHRKPFEETRDEIFAQLARLMGFRDAAAAWESADARRFLGYSPVLEGIASFLCVDDFRSIRIETPSVSGNLSEWGFLCDLLEELLRREQSKFVHSWQDELKRPMFSSTTSANGIFDIDEQCDRLIAQVELQASRVE